MRLIDTKNKHRSVDTSLEEISDANSTCTYDSAEHNKLPFCDICKGLKFAIPIGLLSFLVCHQALADTELSGGQPMAYIGDLVDISTGFASVRKTSFKLLMAYSYICGKSLMRALFSFYHLLTCN